MARVVSPLRIGLVLILDALALMALAALLSGFEVDSAWAAIGMAAVIGLLNALVWPVLSRYTLPLSVLSLGLSALLLNGALILLAAAISPGVELNGFWAAVVVVVGMAAITALLSALLAIDDDESWQRNVVRRQARRRGDVEQSEVPGIVFCEIDGLAHDVLRRALRTGHAPNLARLLADDGYRIESWETDWSSQTGACQAGLLHGDSVDIPAFRWWEKDTGRPMVTNHPRDAAALERRHSDGRGLLHEDGASRANILSGDATHSLLTMSTVLERRPPIGRDYAAYFARPYGVARTLVLVLADLARERFAYRRQRRDDVRPRIARPWSYAVVRAWAVVIQRDLQVASVVGDMLSGRPVIYTTFLAYDEVAHHSGIERADTLAVLRLVDREIARIAKALPDAARPYKLVVLADHGQSQGATFLQRYGVTLEQVVRAACEAEDVHSAAGGEDEALAYLSAGLTEFSRDETVSARMLREATGKRRAGGAVALDPAARAEVEREGLPELSVMASGNLGSVTLPREPGRLTLERLGELHPRLLAALVAHPGIAFALVRTEKRGAVALGKHGAHWVDERVVEGEDPLAPFGPYAADHVRRTDGYAHCPDIVLNSTYWEAADEVAAFEELVGSHGGMGGAQGHPFVLFPAELPYPEEPVVGPDSLHQVLRGWLVHLGHAAYASSRLSPGASTRASTDGAKPASAVANS
jgi:uncharacterized membrane protein YvlD (DUF360 family)